MARSVVTAVLVEGRSRSEVARDHGVSRRWVTTLVQRFLAEGEAGLEPRSRRPRHGPQRVAATVVDEVVTLRKEPDEAGHDSRARTIAFHLERRHGHAPAVSTIHRVLARRGFVVSQPHKRPKSSYVRFEADQPNERWQPDVTHRAPADGTGVEILNRIDDHSGFLVGSDARVVFKAADVVTCFRRATARHGLPAQLLSDNGAVSTGVPRGGGRVALGLELVALGIGFRHSRPHHPRTCGKVERFHRTLKRWLDRRPRARTLRALQARLDAFVDYYNTRRPHRALRRRTPAEAFDARPEATPVGRPTQEGHHRVRRDRVHAGGVVTLRHDSRLHHIGLGRRHAGARVLVLVHDLEVRVLTEDGELIRELTLDPGRDYQRQRKS